MRYLFGSTLAACLLAAPLAFAEPPVRAIDRVVIPVSDLARAARFYTEALGFEADTGATKLDGLLHLGRERIELVSARGRPYPAGSRSNDLWFQHLAIVVSDIDHAYERVTRAGAVPISTAPQILPAWNPSAGGIKAFYFRDPDGHPLELIQFPNGKGKPRWQDKSALFLGIDHTAIAVADTTASLGFYCQRLGLHVIGDSDNWGTEQELLSAVPGAHVRITSLRADAGPGIEFLQYLWPLDGRLPPRHTEPQDLWGNMVVMIAATAPAVERLRDPDGHIVRLDGSDANGQPLPDATAPERAALP